ncbi:MAG: glycine zipper domain-containing protein [Verrucomicrobiales bacterium]|nr:glycine zipper domain-containing protein [Verrucomicrobiales bacterium]
MKKLLILTTCIAAMISFTSCTPGERGAVTGAAIGAGTGALIGDSTGALIGGAIGAVAGSEISKNRAARNRNRYYY